MKARRRTVGSLLAIALLATGACGGGGNDGEGAAPAPDGEERTVLVDYKHDQFASAFLGFYPEVVKVRAGDAVRFKQSWTGEPHSVTMGTVVDQMLVLGEKFADVESEQDALDKGFTPEQIGEFLGSAAKVPGMVAYEGFEIYQPGAQPCFIDDEADVPAFSDPESEEIDPDAACPEPGRAQPAFDGTQALYNSGFISPEGDDANEFVLPIAEDTKPGTYQYFCNYHWTSMSGTVEVVAADTEIPSQEDLNRAARAEIEKDAESALEKVEAAKKAKAGAQVDDLTLPLAGRVADDEFAVIINEFFPSKLQVDVDEPVTWTFDGITHTVSFNVPKYFPVFTVKDDGEVAWNPKSFQPVAWDVPDKPDDGADGEEEPEPRRVDVGEWDGSGGFHSSGALDPGETFTVTFTKAGTYNFACVLHPQMVGTVTVKA